MAPRKLILVTAAALLAIGLGACSRSGTETGPVENQTIEAPESSDTPAPVATATPDEAVDTPAPTAPDATDVNTAAEIAPEAAAPAPDAQMMDDASATGMTSRSSRGEQTSNDTAADQPNN